MSLTIRISPILQLNPGPVKNGDWRFGFPVVERQGYFETNSKLVFIPEVQRLRTEFQVSKLPLIFANGFVTLFNIATRMTHEEPRPRYIFARND